MIELALQVATVVIFLIALVFAWESTKLVEEKKKRKRDRRDD